MTFRPYCPSDTDALIELYTSVFTAADGESEGILVGGIARDVLSGPADDDRYGFVAEQDGDLIGGILFTRLRFADDVDAFLLSPVAVDSQAQGSGIGQALLTYGLQALADGGVEVVATYGDPAFYTKVGFRPCSPDTLPPPFALSQPEGWLAQSLTDAPLAPVAGPCRCVSAFDDPTYW